MLPVLLLMLLLSSEASIARVETKTSNQLQPLAELRAGGRVSSASAGSASASAHLAGSLSSGRSNRLPPLHPAKTLNRSVSLWIENSTILDDYPPLGAAIAQHAASLDSLFVAGEGAHDSYLIDGGGNLLTIEPAGLQQMASFVTKMHGLGLKVVPMIGAEDRPHVQPAMWSLLMGPRNASQQAAFIQLAVTHARRYGYDGYQLDLEPLSLPEGGLSGINATIAMQRPYLEFLVRLEHALRVAGVGHSVSAAGYAAPDLCSTPACNGTNDFQCYTAAELFRGTNVQLFSMGTYSCDFPAFKVWLERSASTAGANLGVGLNVCGEECKKTPDEIRAVLAQVSAKAADGVTTVAIFDAGPTVGHGRGSRLVADDWLPLLSDWVKEGA